jgi:hypothetical protein
MLYGKGRIRPIQGRLRLRAAQRLICTLSKQDRCCSIALAKGGWHRLSLSVFQAVAQHDVLGGAAHSFRDLILF